MYRLREPCESTPEPLRHRRPCVPCRRRPSTLLQASPVEKGAAGTLCGSWRRSSTRLLERGTRWLRCCTSCAARSSRGGCSVPGGRSVSTSWDCGCTKWSCAKLGESLPPSTWPLAMGRGFVACLPETAFSHCRALRSRASSEELKARKKLKNLEFCYHAHNAKFEKAIPVPTRAPTHS